MFLIFERITLKFYFKAQEEDDQDACEPQSCMPVVTLVSPSSSLQSQSELDELDDEERSILKNLQIIPTLGSQHRPSCRIKINISQQLIKCLYNTLVYKFYFLLLYKSFISSLDLLSERKGKLKLESNTSSRLK